MKQILLLALAIVTVQGVFADELEKNGKSIYFGTEAAPYGDNPCKGKTTRECAVINSKFVAISDGKVQVTRATVDMSGAILRQTVEEKLGTVESVKAEYQQMDLKNGASIEMSQQPCYPSKP